MSGKRMKELRRIASENSDSYEMAKNIYNFLKKIDKDSKQSGGHSKK